MSWQYRSKTFLEKGVKVNHITDRTVRYGRTIHRNIVLVTPIITDSSLLISRPILRSFTGCQTMPLVCCSSSMALSGNHPILEQRVVIVRNKRLPIRFRPFLRSATLESERTHVRLGKTLDEILLDSSRCGHDAIHHLVFHQKSNHLSVSAKSYSTCRKKIVALVLALTLGSLKLSSSPSRSDRHSISSTSHDLLDRFSQFVP